MKWKYLLPALPALAASAFLLIRKLNQRLDDKDDDPPMEHSAREVLEELFPEAEISFFSIDEDGNRVDADGSGFDMALEDCSADDLRAILLQAYEEAKLDSAVPYPHLRNIEGTDFSEN